MIEALKDFPDNVVAFDCRGKVTAEDYESVLVPRVEQALEQGGKLRLYYRVGSDFEGIEPSAVWKDFKVGVEHLSRWEKFAVVTDVDWIRHTVNALGFLFPGEVEVYPTSEESKARQWILAD